MSIARITIMNFKEERDVKMSEEIYMSVQKDYFPNAELVVNVQTGEKSLLSLAIYPSYEEAEKNLEGREKFQKSIEATLVESFYYEGDLTYFYKNPSTNIISKYNEDDRLYFESRNKNTTSQQNWRGVICSSLI